MKASFEEAIQRLAEAPCIGYHTDASWATEPTSLAALALLGHGHLQAARPALDWLAKIQNDDGSLGVTTKLATPCWPTGLAIVAWSQFHRTSQDKSAQATYRQAIENATRWILSARGEKLEQTEILGHNVALVGWSWIQGTHSWIEPTAIELLALQTLQLNKHRRAREATRMLIDRLLPEGGCNYGNTRVCGSLLRPHVQPTGLAILALAASNSQDVRIPKSLDYLQKQVTQTKASLSLSWALLGLAAHGQFPESADALLQAALERTLGADKPSYHLVALLTLARLGRQSPLVQLPQLMREDER